MAKQKQGQGDGTITTLAVVGDGTVEVDVVDHAEVRSRVQELRARVEQDGWDLSVALFEVYDGALYQAWGYSSWTDYVEKELEFQIRKAQYYVAVQSWVRAFAPDFVEWVRACGLGKARLMSGRVQPDEASLWRTRLDGKTYREMEALLKGEDPDDNGSGDGEGGGEGSGEGSSGGAESTTTLRFALYPAQQANVQLALERAKVQGETDKDGHALDLICTDYLAGNGHLKNRDEHLTSVERALGVRLVAFKVKGDMDAARIVYGGDFMDALQEKLQADEEHEENAGGAGDDAN